MTAMLNRSGFPIRDLAVLLGLVAVLLRGLIAPGLMPDLKAAADGELNLVICSSSGLKAFAPVSNGQVPAHQDASDLCPFAAFGHLATPVHPLSLDGRSHYSGIEQLPHRDGIAASTVRVRHARAPPRHA